MTSKISKAILDSLTDVTMPRLPSEPNVPDTIALSGHIIPIVRSGCIIVGSGAAGLRAAVELKRRGNDVTIISQSAWGGTSACSGSDKQTLHTRQYVGSRRQLQSHGACNPWRWRDGRRHRLYRGGRIRACDGDPKIARSWLTTPINPNGLGNIKVVFPLLNGSDITKRPSGRWIINFGEMKEAEAALFERPFEYVVLHVKPKREKNRDKQRRDKWWRLGRSGSDLRMASTKLYCH